MRVGDTLPRVPYARHNEMRRQGCFAPNESSDKKHCWPACIASREVRVSAASATLLLASCAAPAVISLQDARRRVDLRAFTN